MFLCWMDHSTNYITDSHNLSKCDVILWHSFIKLLIDHWKSHNMILHVSLDTLSVWQQKHEGIHSRGYLSNKLVSIHHFNSMSAEPSCYSMQYLLTTVCSAYNNSSRCSYIIIWFPLNEASIQIFEREIRNKKAPRPWAKTSQELHASHLKIDHILTTH
jgi:hypothetical protein